MAKALIGSLAIVAAIIIIGSAAMYAVEINQEGAKIKSGLDATWWAVSTITTVGYGDIVPVTELGKAISIVYMFSGISMIGIIGTVLGTKFYKKKFSGIGNLGEIERQALEKINELERKSENQERILKEILDKLNKS